jgi:excisionase family DNA binding protein
MAKGPGDEGGWSVNSQATTLPNGDQLLRLREVAAVMKLSEKTVRRLIDAGKLLSIKISGFRMVKASELQRFVDQAQG